MATPNPMNPATGAAAAPAVAAASSSATVASAAALPSADADAKAAGDRRGAPVPPLPPAVQFQYMQSVDRMASLQAIDADLKYRTDAKGADLIAQIDFSTNFSNIFQTLEDKLVGEGLPELSPKALAEIARVQQNGTFVYPLSISRDGCTTYEYVVYHKNAAARGDFRRATISDVYRIVVGETETAILHFSEDSITDEKGFARCANKALAIKDGVLKLVTTPLSADDLHDSLEAADEGRCTIA